MRQGRFSQRPASSKGRLMHHFTCFSALLLFCSMAAAPLLAQTLYKSTGPDGKIVYSDKPPVDGKTEKLKFQNLPATPMPEATAAAYAALLRKAGAVPMPAAPVAGTVLYSATWCGYCRLARAWLNQKGVAFQEIDIDTPQGMAGFAQAAGGGKGGVPLLMVAGRKLQGYSPEAYAAAFLNTR
jgi:glutaredoxin